MDRLLGLEEIKARYQLQNDRVARNRMMEMGPVQTRPILVRESAVDAWDAAQEAKRRQKTAAQAAEVPKPRGRKKKTVLPFPQMEIGPLKPGQYISRERPKAIAR